MFISTSLIMRNVHFAQCLCVLASTVTIQAFSLGSREGKPVLLALHENGDLTQETVSMPTNRASARTHRHQASAANSTHKLPRDTTPFTFCMTPDHGFVSSRNHTKTRRRKRQAVGSFVVETIVVLDYPLFLFWMERNNNDITATRGEMVDYYSNLMEAVNRRFSTLLSQGLNVRLVVNAFVIAETPGSSPWTQTLNVSGRVDASKALDNLEGFLLASNGQIGGIPYDHAFIITGFDLSVGDETSVAGIAAYRTCSVRSGSITEELKSESTAAVIAHEIGHALSSLHDGDGNSCDPNESFIMSPTIGLPPKDKPSHPWRFSTCTASAFRDFLVGSAGSCTRTLSGAPQDLSPFMTQQFGQKYPPDVQCEIFLGPQSKLCRRLYDGVERNFDDLCRTMYCDDPNSKYCFSIPPHDGTSCGNKKWCQMGVCVQSEEAPARVENCPAGDDPSLNCVSADCTDPDVKNFLCCDTCNPVPTPVKSTPSMYPLPKSTASMYVQNIVRGSTPSMYPPQM